MIEHRHLMCRHFGQLWKLIAQTVSFESLQAYSLVRTASDSPKGKILMVAYAADQMGNVSDHDFITYGMRIHHRDVCGVIFQVFRVAEPSGGTPPTS
jgi:hypothetical protein